jgi:hypothetical protein
MSSLGIRFALPYKGSNGIKVQGNIISIDSTVQINIKSIISEDILSERIQATDSIKTIDINTNNTLFETNVSGNEIILKNSGNQTTCLINVDGVYVYKNNLPFIYLNSDEEQFQVYDDTDNKNFAILRNGNTGLNLISFSGGAQESQIGVIQNIAITPNLTKYIELVINGVTYKLITAN